MRRYDGKSAQEIAEEMGLSQRTIENHLFMGMKQMRSYIKMCI
jgi:RNA polymerase sigma-70 factor (ECF subfamily)